MRPIAAGHEPNLVLYCAIVIVATLGMFTLWAVVSWAFSVAPLLAMRATWARPRAWPPRFGLGRCARSWSRSTW